jgi:hypothetical protein
MAEENTVVFYPIPDEEFLARALDLSYFKDKNILVAGDKESIDRILPHLKSKLNRGAKTTIFTKIKSLMKNFYVRTYNKVFVVLADIPSGSYKDTLEALIRYQEPGTICTMVCPLYLTEPLLKGFFNGRALVGHITVHNRFWAVVIAVRY